MKAQPHLATLTRVALIATLLLCCGFGIKAWPHRTTQSHLESVVVPPSSTSAPYSGRPEARLAREPLVQSLVQSSEAETEHRAWEVVNAIRTYWLGVAMAVIALLQLLLFAVQLAMMRRNIADTANAARAAELNAKAAIGIELPFLRAIPTDLLATDGPLADEGPYGGYVNDRPPVAYNVLGPIEITNLGRTPAYSMAVSIGWIVAFALPEVPPPFQFSKRMNHNLVLAGGAETHFDSDACIALSEEEVLVAARGAQWLWVFGKIEYRDFMDQLQSTCFCWRFANRNAPGDRQLYYLSSDGEPPTAYTRRTSNINV